MQIRVLGMSVEHAEKETKRKNSFCLVRKRGGHHARAVYFFCDDEEDYKQWFFGLAEATMIKVILPCPSLHLTARELLHGSYNRSLNGSVCLFPAP